MKKILFIFCFLTSFSVISQEEKRLALVIGNANYEKGELKNPVNDARLMASTLDSLDFDVILKEKSIRIFWKSLFFSTCIIIRSFN